MTITVIGDLLLDRDLDGPSTRHCPDSEAPVIDVERSIVRPGGAGLVARLLSLDGQPACLVSAISDDPAARELRRSLGGVELIAGALRAPTPEKIRVFAQGRPVARLDQGCAPPPPPEVTREMLGAIETAELIVVADYGRGLTAVPAVRSALRRRAERVPLIWDPHPHGAPPVPGATVVTPNLAEARTVTGATDHEPRFVARMLLDRWLASAVLVTLGADGAWLDAGRGPQQSRHIAAPAVSTADPCGAGDRLVASLATGLSGVGLSAAVEYAVRQTAEFLAAGGVRALPTAPPEPHAPVRAASAIIDRVRAVEGTVVATGGCFDLFHAGHLRTLRAARAEGDALIVCLNSDASVRRLKGPGRPLIGQDDRAELLRGLDCVDAVVMFDEDTPLAVLDRLRPDVWVKGGDYVPERLPEHDLLAGWGGRCLAVPYQPGRSTTTLAESLARIA